MKIPIRHTVQPDTTVWSTGRPNAWPCCACAHRVIRTLLKFYWRYNWECSQVATTRTISDKLNNWLWALYIKTSWIVSAARCELVVSEFLQHGYLEIFPPSRCQSAVLLPATCSEWISHWTQFTSACTVTVCCRLCKCINIFTKVPIYCLSACNVQANPTARMLLLLMEILKRSWISTRNQSMLKGACIDAVAHADSVTIWAGAFLLVLAGAIGALEVAILYEPKLMMNLLSVFLCMLQEPCVHERHWSCMGLVTREIYTAYPYNSCVHVL